MSGECNVCGQNHAEIRHCAFKDEIDRLEAENKKLKKVIDSHEWVSVEDDKKPERETSAEDNTEYEDYSEDVFVYGWDGAGEERIETGWYDFAKSKWESGSCEVVITHWIDIVAPKE